MTVPHLACMALVATLYDLPPRVLPSIQAVEGGRPGLASRNANGSEDLGVMQVNTLWLPALSSYTGLSQIVLRDRLMNEPCFNIAAAGAILPIAMPAAVPAIASPLPVSATEAVLMLPPEADAPVSPPVVVRAAPVLAAAIGALAGGGKGAALGAVSGGTAGFIYDRLTHNS